MKYTLLFIATLALVSCSMHRKISHLSREALSAGLELTEESYLPQLDTSGPGRDTLVVKGEDGRDILIMKAVRGEDGDMVATDVIEAAVVTARFRNIAERDGKVQLRFDVTVPKAMQDNRWQLRLVPVMQIRQEKIRLDPLVITGSHFRQEQLRGYEHYEKFLATIITDSDRLIDMDQLERFIKRNIPQLYALKGDSSYVSDESLASLYGVTAREAAGHYRKSALNWRNERKKASKEKMFRRYVKSPIVREGLRLDTVITGPGADFTYSYVQDVATRAGLRKIDLGLSGGIYDYGKKLYDIPESEPLTFYVSSISWFADTTILTGEDTTYRYGLKALSDRDFRTAANLLGPYRDWNSAVAYCAMGMNASALQILENLEHTDRCDYLMALIYSRMGKDNEAVQLYLDACRKNPALISRGNLDPEISVLVSRYRLNEGTEYDDI